MAYGDEDVDVNMVEGHSIVTAGTDEPKRNLRGAFSEIREGKFATRVAHPVASVSTSVPHGGTDPVHFRNQIPARQRG